MRLEIAAGAGTSRSRDATKEGRCGAGRQQGTPRGHRPFSPDCPRFRGLQGWRRRAQSSRLPPGPQASAGCTRTCTQFPLSCELRGKTAIRCHCQGTGTPGLQCPHRRPSGPACTSRPGWPCLLVPQGVSAAQACAGSRPGLTAAHNSEQGSTSCALHPATRTVHLWEMRFCDKGQNCLLVKSSEVTECHRLGDISR